MPQVIGEITKPVPTDDFYVVNDTSVAGGYRVVLDLLERDSIVPSARKEGMLVFVQSDSHFYKLLIGLSNIDWEDLGDTLGGSEITYTNLTPMDASFRGVEAGESFNGLTIKETFDKIFYPYLVPTFSSFAISGQVSPLEVGNTILSGNKTFTWGTTNPTNIQLNSIKIVDVSSGNIDLGINLLNDGNEVLNIPNDITKVTNTNHTFRIIGTNTKLANFQRDYNVVWQWRMYWGFSPLETLTSSDILLFTTSKLATSRNGTITLGTNSGTNYDYIVYPESWGLISNIIDTGSGFSLTAAYTNEGVINHTNQFGASTNYRVYKSTTASAGKSGWNLQIS